MSLFKLAWKNLSRSTFRSSMIFLCAALLAGSVFAATAFIQETQRGLEANLERLGADILVNPWGSVIQRSEVQDIRLSSAQTNNWMPREFIAKVAAVPGVAAVTSQLFVTAVDAPQYLKTDPLILIAFEPSSDFVLRPWFTLKAAQDLPLGAAVAGSRVNLPSGQTVGQTLHVFGYDFQVVNRLEPTGTDVDRTLFFSFETAADFAQRSTYHTETGLALQTKRISAILVRVDKNQDSNQVYMDIIKKVERVKPLKSTDMFQAQRKQLIGLVRSQVGILSALWLMAVIFVGLVFTIVVNERRQEIGVLRALGATRVKVFKSILAEGVILALSGGAAGLFIAILSLWILQGQDAKLTGLPIHLPAFPMLAAVSLGGLLIAVLSITIASAFPSWRIIRQEVANVMRE